VIYAARIYILRAYGPYLSSDEVATICMPSIASRTTPTESSALVVRNCHSSQLDMVLRCSCYSKKTVPFAFTKTQEFIKSASMI
jgi:hypothetical protein